MCVFSAVLQDVCSLFASLFSSASLCGSWASFYLCGFFIILYPFLGFFASLRSSSELVFRLFCLSLL